MDGERHDSAIAILSETVIDKSQGINERVGKKAQKPVREQPSKGNPDRECKVSNGQKERFLKRKYYNIAACMGNKKTNLP